MAEEIALATAVESPDITTTAYQRLASWIDANGGNRMLASAPTPGSWIEKILAFLQAIMPLLGCALAAQKRMASDRPLLARLTLRRQAKEYGFQLDEIGQVVDASMHLATTATDIEYAAFAAA